VVSRQKVTLYKLNLLYRFFFFFAKDFVKLKPSSSLILPLNPPPKGEMPIVKITIKHTNIFGLPLLPPLEGIGGENTHCENYYKTHEHFWTSTSSPFGGDWGRKYTL